jgi:hypothetical protein
MTTRADMAGQLALSPVSATKTYVVEAHTPSPAACLSDLPGQVEATEDAFLYRVATPKGLYWVDQLDERFWGSARQRHRPRRRNPTPSAHRRVASTGPRLADQRELASGV